jgi:16S rRNA (guanine527-N7)-methyltransferase
MTAPTPQAVAAGAARLGRAVTPEQAELLATYLDQLVKWNRKMNLVGKAGWEDVLQTLVVDSLYLADFLAGLPLPKEPLTLDLGAGAGLPGIPLRALWQGGEYRLVEVREKRVLFMRSVLGRLGLPGTSVFHGRAEDVTGAPENSGGTNGRSADLILSRAFMPWRKLLGFVRPMLAQDGLLVILSNDPPPSPDELPGGWKCGGHADYPAAGTTRYFWSLSPA